MDDIKLNSVEIDTIGEVLNISLGAASTAVSNMLSARVDITTPIVKTRKRDNITFEDLEPAIGVVIKNEAGLTGSNIMILKRNDVRLIVGMLMGHEIPDEEFEFDELTESAIGEVMNQMMGASATALSELMERVVDISTPIIIQLTNIEQFKDEYFDGDDVMVEVAFNLSIENVVASEFVYLLNLGLAKEIVSGFFKDGMPEFDENGNILVAAEVAPEPVAAAPSGGVLSEAEIAALLNASAAPEPPAPSGGVMSEAEIAALIGGGAAAQAPVEQPVQVQQPVQQAMPQMQQTMGAPVMTDPNLTNTLTQMMQLMQKQFEMTQMQLAQLQASGPKKIKADQYSTPQLRQEANITGDPSNLDLVMGVPVDISVEIGRTKKLVKDVLELNKGSLVVLDRLAGEQVDLFVNGQCIAQGDVVVIDDSIGIRISEILNNDMSFLE